MFSWVRHASRIAESRGIIYLPKGREDAMMDLIRAQRMKWAKSLLLVIAVGAAPLALSSEPPRGLVLVEVIEGVPDKANWDFEPTKPSESYTESAFGFGTMPTRYSSKGI